MKKYLIAIALGSLLMITSTVGVDTNYNIEKPNSMRAYINIQGPSIGTIVRPNSDELPGSN